MVLYLLKSGVCLAIFYGFYKLLLEKASFHNFKRFYLLATLVVAFGIPFITFTEYVEPVPMAPVQEFNFQPFETTVIEETPKTNYLPIILWSVYGAGVLFFGFMFFKNLWGLIGKIKRNPKLKSKNFINVLLNDLAIPHTFFNYIFLNKHKFETQQIPKEVLLHEETHAKQKHSLDILLIELLQVIFWFNPFIYLFKHSIKLNHEFLADRAVLKQGTASSTYQNMLLAFSSNASEPQLANAINYSSIKKRFTVMKTHTTKKALWLRSLFLLPLLAVLIYSFSDRKVVEKETSESNTIQPITKEDNATETNTYENSQELKATLNYNILILINDKGQLLVNDFMVEINNLKNSLNDLTKNLTNEQKENIIVNLKTHEEAPEKVITKVNTILRELKFLKFNLGQTYIYQEPLNPKSASPEETEHLNEILKKLSLKTDKQREIEQSDLNFIKYMYDKMTEEKEVNKEPFPNYPPPPPPIMEPENPSEKLIEIRSAYIEKAKDFGKARQNFYENNMGNASELTKLNQSMMTLYKEYSDLAKEELEKENASTPPSPVEKSVNGKNYFLLELKFYELHSELIFNLEQEGEIVRTKDLKNAKIVEDYFILTLKVKELYNKRMSNLRKLGEIKTIYRVVNGKKELVKKF